MNIQYLEKCLRSIQVRNVENDDVEVVNNSPLQMIGKGRQGAVFRVSDDICVKVFGNEEDCEREYYALSLGKDTDLFPKVLAKGERYIAMDFIKGVDVREYLQSQPLTKELSAKLIEMLITFKKIGFERIDHHKRQIYIQPDGNLKVIDVGRTVWRDRVYPYPRKLLTSLGEKNKAIFLSHVQQLAPELYEEWKHYMEMEQLSRKIYKKVLAEYKPTQHSKVTKQSKKLLTTVNKVTYKISLEGLMHKVFKEEWMKTMLAQGYNPEQVIKKIDEYWDEKQSNGKNAQQERKKNKRKNESNKEKHRNKWNKVTKKEKGRARLPHR